MPSLTDRLKLLARLGAPAAEATLVAALPHADPREIDAFARALLAQQRPSGLAMLLRHYRDLAPDLRGQLADTPSDLLIAACRDVFSAGGDGQLLATLSALSDLARPELAHLAVEWVQSQQEAVAQAAARALLATARGCPRDPTGHRRLDRALAPALRSYEVHRSDTILLAAALQLPHAGPETHAVLGDDEQAALMPLRSLLRRTNDEQMLAKLLPLLLYEPVRGAIRQRLANPNGLADHQALLAQAHLACVPGVRSELRQVDRPLRALPGPLEQAELTPTAQLGYPRFVSGLRLIEKVRTERLADGVAFTASLARLLALQALLARGTEGADQAVVHFCFDREERIARLATRYIVRRSPERLGESLRSVRLLRRSPHEPVRRLMLGTPAGPDSTFEAAWDLALKGRPLGALIIARAALKRDKKAVVESLRRRVVNGSRQQRLRAIVLARQLNLLPHAELELLACLTGDDSRVAATAASALGEVESPASADALTACLDHPDGRVQANAVEAIDRRLPWRGAVEALAAGVEPVQKLLGAEANRSRANALRTLLRAGCAQPRQVAEMLRDERPLHRISGIWLVGKLRLTEVQEEVEKLATRHESPPVQQRAEVVVRRLRGTPRTAVPIAIAPQREGEAP